MNCIARSKKGFAIRDTTESETKGIWIWCKKHPKQSDHVLVLFDTEGLDDPEKGDLDHDNKIFCLTFLLSSTLILNVKGVLDYGTFDKLAFIASLPTMLKVLDEEADVKTNAKTIRITSPNLVICIRDFFLKTEKDGKTQTPDEYLENKLKLVDKSTASKKHRKFNQIKSSIKEFFPKRKCFTIAQPTMGNNLKNIEMVSESSLSEEFVKDIKEVQNYVYERNPKYICNVIEKPLDGTDLASLITSFVKALSEDSYLDCQDVYEQVVVQHNKRVVRKVFSDFKNDMDNGNQLKNKEKLADIFLKAFDTALSTYREESFFYIEDRFEQILLEAMNDHLDMMIKELRRRCTDKGMTTLSRIYEVHIQPNKDRYSENSTGYSNYEDDLEKLKDLFLKDMKDYDKDELNLCFNDFTKKKLEVLRLHHMVSKKTNKQDKDDDIGKCVEKKVESKISEEHEKRTQELEKELEKIKCECKELRSWSRMCSIM